MLITETEAEDGRTGNRGRWSNKRVDGKDRLKYNEELEEVNGRRQERRGAPSGVLQRFWAYDLMRSSVLAKTRVVM